MSAAIIHLPTSGASFEPTAAKDSGARSFTPVPFRVTDLIARQNRIVGATTQAEQSSEDGLAADATHHSSSSEAITIALGSYLPQPMFAQAARNSFRAIQKWEGHVFDVSADTFRARLTPLRGEGPEQEAEIYLEEIDDDDRALVKPGAVFYWSIGYLDRPSGRQRTSIIRFRRLPGWTRHELTRAEAEVERLRALFADE